MVATGRNRNSFFFFFNSQFSTAVTTSNIVESKLHRCIIGTAVTTAVHARHHIITFCFLFSLIRTKYIFPRHALLRRLPARDYLSISNVPARVNASLTTHYNNMYTYYIRRYRYIYNIVYLNCTALRVSNKNSHAPYVSLNVNTLSR